MHSEVTKANMSANGIKGTKAISINGVRKYKYSEQDLVGADISSAWNDADRLMASERQSDTIWYTHARTGKNIRLKSGKTPPDGYHEGRTLNNVAFKHDPNKKWVFDFA